MVIFLESGSGVKARAYRIWCLRVADGNAKTRRGMATAVTIAAADCTKPLREKLTPFSRDSLT
jgi:hypothetical protein